MARGRLRRMGRRALLPVLVVLGTSVACGEEPTPDPGVEEAPTPAPPPADVVVEGVWSPDGRRLVATWDQGAGARLFGLLGPTADGAPPAAGTGLPLTRGAGSHATWAPDGLWIAYGSGGDIVRARPDGTGPERLTSGPDDDREPDYSPDGRRLVFVSDRGGTGAHLWTMDANGGEPTPITATAPGSGHGGPAWSPTGRVIAYSAVEDSTTAVYVASADGSGFGRIGPGAQPEWSPDGERIYFAEHDSIFWRPPSGGARRLVLPGGRAPRASPDGRWLSFVRGSAPSVSLWLYDLETSTETRITP